ncbi:winged helix-turn-helix domain-containing protein [Marinicella litoralis]|nr:winged helix-turn-helix domain-containing protein [Marinicella litoralis]
MNQPINPRYLTAQIQIAASTSEVTGKVSGKQEVVRLSPVNMRVLLVLLKNAENVASRQQLFDEVWPNQVVSDDALTRCISDLRSQLKPLTQMNQLIGTIPKVGYRWLPPVKLMDEDHAPDIFPQTKKHWQQIAKTAVLALLAFMLMTWGILGLINWLEKPTTVPMIILPTEVIQPSIKTPPSQITGLQITNALKIAALNQNKLQFLTPYAVKSHQGNPFPYFNHEFGVKWFIESQISHQQGKSQVTLNLVDAKTALVIYSDQRHIENIDDIKRQSKDFMSFIVEL